MSEETSDICHLSEVSYSVRVYDTGERNCVSADSDRRLVQAVLVHESVVVYRQLRLVHCT